MAESPVSDSLERGGALLRLTLARPKANVIDSAMIAALDERLARHADDVPLRGVLLDHDGPHFSFGASIQEHFPDAIAAMLERLHALLLRMLDYPVPIFAAVRGQCLGGGLELVSATSQIFAAEDAAFGQPEIRLGVIAPAGSCLLPERIGRAAAEELLLTGRSLSAREALAAGLAHEVAADPAAAAVAWFEQHLEPLSAVAVRHALAAVRDGYVERIAGKLARVERRCAGELMATHDAVEGLKAFVDKRAPAWRHR